RRCRSTSTIWPTIGWRSNVEEVGVDACRGFFNTYYAANNLSIVVVGDFEREPTLARERERFGRLRAAPEIPRNTTKVTPQRGERRAQILYDVQLPMLMAGWHAPATGHPDGEALDVASTILSGGRASRLYRSLVYEQEKALYAVGGYMELNRAGLFYAQAQARPGVSIEEVERLFMAEIDGVADAGVSEEEVARAKTQMEVGLIEGRETAEGRARRLGHSVVLAGDIDFERRYIERVRAVTPEDVVAAARKYLTPSGLTVSVLASDKKPAVTDAELREAAGKGWEDKAATPVVTSAGGKAHARVSSVSTQASDGGPAGPVGMDRAALYPLPGGARLIVRRNPEVPTVAIHAAFRGGLRFEPPADQGLSRAVATMLTRGTETRTARELAASIEDLAGDLSGYSGYNTFGVQGSFLAQDFDAGLALLADVLLHSTFPESELAKVRDDMRTDLRSRADSPSHMAFLEVRRGLYGDGVHPYGRDIFGTAESISGLTSEKLKNYLNSYAVAPNLVLAIVGDVDPAEVVAKVKRALAPMLVERPFTPPPVPPVPDFHGPKVREKSLPKEQSQLALAYPAVSLDSPDRFPLTVLSSAMSGQGGRLFLDLRDKRSLAYVVTSQLNTGVDPGFFFFYIASAPEKTDAAIDGLNEQIDRLIRDGITPEELGRAQNVQVGGYEIGLQANGSQASDMALNEINGLGYDEAARYPRRIYQVTRDDVLAAARKYLRADRALTVLIRGTKGDGSEGADTGAGEPPVDP
ncbi:MAG: insulinase family protein, partial [Myxococcales bacterium]|nr:insulinase family protein [Myxococcales bacterium]